MLKKIDQFLKKDIWRIRIRKLPRHQFFLLRLLRTFLLAVRGFDEDKCQLRASALTFYMLLSVVPMLALAFGIAKGFGFQENLESLITEKLQTHQEVSRWVIQFSHTLLAQVRGGLMAGIGVVLLFWTVIKVLGNIEKSFNDIWGIKQGRSFRRKFSEYLSIMLICPFLLIVSSSLTVFISSQITQWAERMTFLKYFSETILYCIKLIPYGLVWVVFMFLYLFMPNTKVSFKAGALAGFLAGTFYQMIQWIYIRFQIGVTQYNAVYGSFAALPLFLVWLQASWLIVLFGAEIAFAFDHEETYELEAEASHISLRLRRLLALRIVELCAKHFAQGEKPLDALSLSHQLEAPIRLIRDILYDLVRANILSQVKDGEGEECYQPAQDLEHLTLKKVMDLLDKSGNDDVDIVQAKELETISAKLEAFDRAIEKSPENVLLKNLP